MNRRYRAIILVDSWQDYRAVIVSHGLDGRVPSGRPSGRCDRAMTTAEAERMRRAWESKGEPVAVLDWRQRQVTATTRTNGGS